MSRRDKEPLVTQVSIDDETGQFIETLVPLSYTTINPNVAPDDSGKAYEAPVARQPRSHSTLKKVSGIVLAATVAFTAVDAAGTYVITGSLMTPHELLDDVKDTRANIVHGVEVVGGFVDGVKNAAEFINTMGGK